uniref:Uncharacterized protein n=1 Tax=Arundo donax TaxID=35708 RepID=A0A0A9F4M3_ARUDO
MSEQQLHEQLEPDMHICQMQMRLRGFEQSC